MTSLSEKLLAVHGELEMHKIAHAFGGAIALGYCIAEPRGTIDLDVNVFVPVTESDRVFAALPSLVEIGPDDRDEATTRGQARVWWDDTAIDLFFSYHPFHDNAAARVRHVPFGDAEIPVLDCTDLLVLKAMFSRSKDWVDIAAMTETGSVDLVAAGRWLGELLGTDSVQYRRVFEIARTPSGVSEDVLRDVFGTPSEPKKRTLG
jgi:hypothetical protein